MIYPEQLYVGDTIGIIAPAGPPNIEQVKKGMLFFEQLGLKVKLGEHIDKRYGYLAGTDEERLADFHAMIKDPAIKGIIFAAGGYGTGRIVSAIDYELIKKNPKIIWGYSDITYLHIAIQQQAGLVTFHGPMVSTDVSKENFDDLSAELFNQLFEPTLLHYSEDISPLTIINAGEYQKASGLLTGGNLSLITSTIGTPYEIDTDERLLFIEDVDEPPYKVDGMLNQLEQSGKLANVAGIVIGDFARAEPKAGRPSLTLIEVFRNFFTKLSCPVVMGFQMGHCLPNFSFPLGVQATLDTTQKTLAIEPGVGSKVNKVID